ncbi:MAG TPA: DUF58 domain-containing protein [Pirellulales bacterium]|jgi:uncharacterized protein (DUF58 family)
MPSPRIRQVTIEGLFFLLLLSCILAGALVRQIQLLLMLFSMMVGIPLLNWRLSRATLRRLAIARRIPSSIAAGDLLLVELEASNRRRRLPSWALTIEDRLRREGAPEGEEMIRARALLPCVMPGSSSKQSYRGRMMRRGKYVFGPLRVSTRFPFGLVRGSIVVPQRQTMLVSPRLGRLTPLWQRLQQSSDLGTSNVARRQGLLEGDFYGLRDWRQGDSRRWIHWRTTARRQTPVVRQFEQQRNQDLVLILELWQPERPAPADLDNVELAVSFAASIVADLCRRGGRTLWVATAAQEPQFNSGPASLALTREVMDSLAVVEATSADRLPKSVAKVLEVARPGANAIVISTRSIDWTDTERFSQVWSSPRQRAWLSRLKSINTSLPELAEYFLPS